MAKYLLSFAIVAVAQQIAHAQISVAGPLSAFSSASNNAAISNQLFGNGFGLPVSTFPLGATPVSTVPINTIPVSSPIVQQTSVVPSPSSFGFNYPSSFGYENFGYNFPAYPGFPTPFLNPSTNNLNNNDNQQVVNIYANQAQVPSVAVPLTSSIPTYYNTGVNPGIVASPYNIPGVYY